MLINFYIDFGTTRWDFLTNKKHPNNNKFKIFLDTNTVIVDFQRR